jgi:hypothetical protein
MALSGVFKTGNSILMIALCPGHKIMPLLASADEVIE